MYQYEVAQGFIQQRPTGPRRDVGARVPAKRCSHREVFHESLSDFERADTAIGYRLVFSVGTRQAHYQNRAAGGLG